MATYLQDYHIIAHLPCTSLFSDRTSQGYNLFFLYKDIFSDLVFLKILGVVRYSMVYPAIGKMRRILGILGGIYWILGRSKSGIMEF